MKFIIAPDSFKGSLTALEAANAITDGIKTVYPEAQIDKIPIADGGEGTVDVLIFSTNGKFVKTNVLDPLGRQINAKYGILGDGNTVAIEMSAASGITILEPSELDPLKTTTFGTGQLIKHALDNGYRQFILGIGGSATNDGGTGMAQALGVRFLNSEQVECRSKICGILLDQVAYIDSSNIHPAIKESTFRIASDVNNPLLGAEGCAQIYAPQKGASPEAVKILETNMTKFINVAESTFGTSVRELVGAGAAGGFGAGAVLFLNAEIESGIDIVLKACDFTNRIADADLILTGEGKIDKQTKRGKTIAGVVRASKEQNIPVIAFGGIAEESIEAEDIGVAKIFSIAPKGKSVEYAMQNAHNLLKKKVSEIISSTSW